MFFKKISKEVKELGDEMISFFDEIEIKWHESHWNKPKEFKCWFRGEIILTKYEGCVLNAFAGFGSLNDKEIQFLYKCATIANMKKITFKNNSK